MAAAGSRDSACSSETGHCASSSQGGFTGAGPAGRCGQQLSPPRCCCAWSDDQPNCSLEPPCDQRHQSGPGRYGRNARFEHWQRTARHVSSSWLRIAKQPEHGRQWRQSSAGCKARRHWWHRTDECSGTSGMPVNLGQAVPPTMPKPAAPAADCAKAPKVLFKPKPEYTAEAIKLHIEGTVSVRLRVVIEWSRSGARCHQRSWPRSRRLRHSRRSGNTLFNRQPMRREIQLIGRASLTLPSNLPGKLPRVAYRVVVRSSRTLASRPTKDDRRSPQEP